MRLDQADRIMLGDREVSRVYLGANLVWGNAFSPASLFAQGEPGVWYDPSDFSTMFQDAAGTTPVTAVEQPVGLMLDKSKGLVLGPELVTNGTFDANIDGWSNADSNASITWVSGGLANVKMLTNTGSGAIQDLTLSSGWAKVSVRARKVGTSGNTYIQTYGKSAFATSLSSVTVTSQSFNTYDFIVPATNGGFRVYLKVEFSGATLEVDSVSVRELPGNHAYQPTATSRPVLSARVNLLTKTEQFDDAVWNKARVTTTSNTSTAPDGATTADTISSSGGPSYINYSVGVTSGVGYKFSVYAKAASTGIIQILGGLVGFAGSYANFDLSDGSKGTVSGCVADITDAGNGWWKCTVTQTASRGDTNNFFIALVDSKTSVRAASLSASASVYIWGASLVPANQAHLPYQRVNTTTDYDADPAKFPHYLRFDGVDDWLVTNTITPGTDKVQVFAGVRKLNIDSPSKIVVELSDSSFVNNGTFGLFAPTGLTTNSYALQSRGTALTAPIASGYISPITNILTGLANISNDSAILRVNGTQAASRTDNQGTGNYLDYPLFIGRRGGTSFPFNGHLYSLVLRFGSNLPIETIEQTEAWINGKTGAY